MVSEFIKQRFDVRPSCICTGGEVTKQKLRDRIKFFYISCHLKGLVFVDFRVYPSCVDLYICLLGNGVH